MSEPEAQPPKPRRRVRPIVLGILTVAALTAAGIVHFNAFASHTPEAELAKYTALIEAGSFEAATKLVPLDGVAGSAADYVDLASAPATTAPESIIDQALLSDEFADDASFLPQNFTFTRPASPAPSSIEVGKTITITVDYELDTSAGSVPIRVERLANSWLGMPQWKVVDSLAIPVVAPVNNPQITTMLVNDQAIATSADPLLGYPQFQSFLYPGVHNRAPHNAPYLESKYGAGASPVDFMVIHHPQMLSLNSEREPVLAPPKDPFNIPNFANSVRTEMGEQLKRCLDSPATQPAGACPAELIALIQSGAVLTGSFSTFAPSMFTKPIPFSAEFTEYPSTTIAVFDTYLEATNPDGSTSYLDLAVRGVVNLHAGGYTLTFETAS